MVRTPCCDKNGMKKGTWTPEEDKKLVAYVSRYGCWNWRQLPKFAGLQRCGKSCRLRWMNYLRPNVKRGNYTKEEEEIIITMHNSLGNRWSSIAAKLPGRTDNEVKNHWHTNLKKRVEQSEPSTQAHDHQESTPLECPTSSSSSSSNSSLQETQIEEAEVGPVNAPPSPLNYTPDVLQGLSQLLSPDYQPYPSFDVAAATPSMDDLLSDDSFGFVEAPWSPLWTDSFLGDSFSYETDGFWDPFVDHEMLFAFGSSE